MLAAYAPLHAGISKLGAKRLLLRGVEICRKMEHETVARSPSKHQAVQACFPSMRDDGGGLEVHGFTRFNLEFPALQCYRSHKRDCESHMR